MRSAVVRRAGGLAGEAGVPASASPPCRPRWCCSNLHAWRQREALGLDAVERHETRSVLGAWAILAATGALATVVALVSPPWLPGLAGWLYALLGIVMPLCGRTMSRRRTALGAAP